MVKVEVAFRLRPLKINSSKIPIVNCLNLFKINFFQSVILIYNHCESYLTFLIRSRFDFLKPYLPISLRNDIVRISWTMTDEEKKYAYLPASKQRVEFLSPPERPHIEGFEHNAEFKRKPFFGNLWAFSKKNPFVMIGNLIMLI